MRATTTSPERSDGADRPARWRRLAVPALAVWTLFVWGGRLRNLAADPDGLVGADRSTLALSALFCLLAVMVTVGFVVRQAAPVTVVLATVTVVVWLIRGADIALGDHSAGFIAVHLALAAVSIGLAALAVRSIRYPVVDG